MPSRQVFLDFGGTLVSEPPDPYPTFRSVLGAEGFELSRERYLEADRIASARIEPMRYRQLGQSPSFLDLSIIETLRELGIADPSGRIVIRLHGEFTSPEWRPVYPETVRVLETLSESKVPVHLISNSTDMLVETIARRGWDRFFRSVTFTQEAGAEKPAPAVFHLALARARCPAAEALHVGDSWVADYLGASRIGMRAVWLNRSGRSPPEPCESARDLTGVLPLITN